MMQEKTVAVIIRKSPHGSIYPNEGLRLAAALGEEFEPVTIIMNDGIYAFLKETENSSYQSHLNVLAEKGKKILVDKKSMDERGITPDELLTDVAIKEREEIHRILTKMEVVLTF
ncbi:MAG: DsrE family protein [Candidatus Hodarchaeota archaeon]